MIHAWTRYWTKPDGRISLADQGFLVGPAGPDWLGFGSPDLWSFDQIAERRCLILLGEPGMGKTQTLRAEAEAVLASSDESGDLVLQIDLGATRDESVLVQEIFQSVEFQTWLDGDHELHLFLDSLDEAVLRLGVVGDIILKGVANVDTSRLRLRLACRTADRLPEFELKLLALWPEDQSGIYELAPLRRVDVRMAAEDRGRDPGEFIAQVLQRDVVAFAIKPVTLEMLLDLAEDDVGLPNSQIDLYARGLFHLVAELGERRHRDPQTRGRLTPGQRLTLASRIAGATIVSGRTAIATADTAQPTPDVVTVAQLAGGSEVDRAIAVPTSFEVSDADVREALGTGLFSARGDDLGWAHQTYGEYLAARYLTATEMSSRQVLTLLVADADDGRIVPQLRDVAGWAAAMSPALTDELAAQDPLVLLRGEIALADDERKARLAEALLQERVAEELDRWDPRVRRNLEGLKYEGLDTVLRQRLNPQEPQPVRELACEVAGICRLASLQEDLLELALRNEEPVRLRVDAVRTLRTIGDPAALRQLTPLARDALPEDTDDELKGSALRAICPSVAAATDILPFLTPQKHRDLIGAYSGFLSRELPQALTVDEFPAALEWIRRLTYAHDPMDEFGNLAEQILVRAAETMEREDVLEALAETVAEYLRNHHDLQSFRSRDRSDVFSTEANRHRLVEALVPLMRDGRLNPVDAVSTPRLVIGSDLPWLLERLADAVGVDREATWAELIDWAASFEGADHDLVMAARATSPLLYERTRARFGPVDVSSELAAQMRDNYARQQKWDEERRRFAADPPNFDANVDLLLDRFESGDLDSFWRLSIDIWGEVGRTDVTLGGSDLTTSAGWQRATAERRGRIAAAANVYLREYQPSDTWLLDAGHGYYPASAGYRAIRYLAEHAPDVFATVDTTTLCSWMPAILTFTGYDNDSAFDAWLLKLVEERCFDALTGAARRRVLAEAAHGDGHLFILRRLQPFLRGGLGTELLELWPTEDLPSRPQAQLLKALLRAGVDGAAELGIAALDPDSITSDPDRARELAATLLDSAGSLAWYRIWPLVRDHPDWGGAVFEALADDRDQAGDFRTELAEADLAELFIWLSTRFPADEDPSRAGAHFVGPREQVADYRDQILRILVERGTLPSLQALLQIEDETGRDLSYARIRAEENWRRNSWVPPRPEDVIQLAADAQRRVVLSEADLQRVIVEALEQIQEMLSFQGQAHQVWDTAVRRPKRETEIAAWIADRLRDLLRGRGIIVNREVEVRVNPRGGIGERTDIHVDAIAGERVEGAQQMTVVVEVKGCWHQELRTAMRSQLADEYLSPSQRHGIYLTVLFRPEGWREDGDTHRRQACDRLDSDDLLKELKRQGEDLRLEGLEITPVILDASLS